MSILVDMSADDIAYTVWSELMKDFFRPSFACIAMIHEFLW